MIRVLRRSPVLWGLASLATLVAFYLVVVKTASRAGRELWFRQVERRLVEDRAALLPPAGRRLWGLYRPELPWDDRRLDSLSAAFGTVPGVASWYQSWGDGGDHAFKTEAVREASRRGLAAMVTWEPWLSEFRDRPVLDPESSLVRVARGDYDGYVREWARAAVRARRPFFLRPMHELGNPWYGWSVQHGNPPAVQIAAWRRIVGIFRAEGARNVAFVWTPYETADTLAWPGSEWVDWIGLDVFNYGDLDHGSWLPFAALLEHQLAPVRRFGKPVLVAEVGTSAVGGDPSDWWRDTFASLGGGAFPEVRAVVAFDDPAWRHASGVLVDWGFSHLPGLLERLAPLAPRAGFPTRPRSPS